MLRLDLQFYAFYMTVMSGAVLGLLFDVLRAIRGYFRPGRWVGASADLLFWVVGTTALSGGLFYANWAELRVYALVGIASGAILYLWLASPIVVRLFHLIINLVEWAITFAMALFQKLIWAPVAAVSRVLWSTLLLLAGWGGALAWGGWRVLARFATWAVRPLYGVYRCARLRYLLIKRRRRPRRKG